MTKVSVNIIVEHACMPSLNYRFKLPSKSDTSSLFNRTPVEPSQSGYNWYIHKNSID